MGRSPLTPEARDRARDRILAAAEAVFDREGFEGARIEDVAAQAGLSTGTLYNYFDGKADLVMELQHRRMGEALVGVDAMLQGRAPFAEKLDRYLETFFRFSDQNRVFLAVLRDSPHLLRTSVRTGEARVQQLRGLMEHILGGVGRLMQQGIDQGVLEPRDPGDLAQALLGMTRALALHRLGREDGPEGARALVRDLFLRGAGRAGGPAGGGDGR